MRRWRSELATAALAVAVWVTLFQYHAWHELKRRHAEIAAARARLGELEPIRARIGAYLAARKSLETRLRVIESIEPGRWRNWPRQEPGGTPLADIAAALSSGPPVRTLKLEAGRLEVSFATGSPGAAEDAARILRERGLITSFTVAGTERDGGTLHAILNPEYTTSGAPR